MSLDPKLSARLRRQTRTARARLIWERFAPVLRWAALALALYIAASLFGVWEVLGDPWRLLAILATLATLFMGVLQAVRLGWPSKSEARRRLERDSGVHHRPLDVLEDRPVLSDKVWPAHQRRALADVKTIRRSRPNPTLAPKDPYFLRFALPVLVIAALFISAGFGFERLRQSVSPDLRASVNPNSASFEAWIDPPAYTGRPPIYFRDGTDVSIPVGSEFVARLSGVRETTRPQLRQGWKTRFLPVKRLGDQSFEARTPIDATGEVIWKLGWRTQNWALNTSPDTPPIINIEEPPKADKRDRLVFSYSFEDDYGVESVQWEMAELVDGLDIETAFDGLTENISVPISGASVKRAEATSSALDLTKHIWAGRKVVGRLVATDGAGQTAYSGMAWFTVPDKIFVEPLAKAVVEHRQLIQSAAEQDYTPRPLGYPEGRYNEFEPEFRMDRAPEPVQRVALLIDAVTDRPDRLFNDPAVYMGLRHVARTIRYADSREDIAGLDEALWKIALRAEYGVLGTALEEMREAEAALREGMSRRAPQREIDTLFERYNEAVDKYTEELRRKALEEGNFAEAQPGGGGGPQSLNEIEELMKAIEEANKAGDVDGARKALARLSEVLENMKIQLAKGGGGGGDGEPLEGEMSEEMKKNLEELADMMGDQRDLQDETRQAEREQFGEQSGEGQAGEGQAGDEPGGEQALSPQELAQRQGELEQLLDKLGEGLPSDLLNENSETPGGGGEEDGDTPSGGGDERDQNNAAGGGEFDDENVARSTGTKTIAELLDDAREAMRTSEGNLGEGQFGAADQAQDEALRALREAGTALAEAATEGQQGEQANVDADGESEDPLGRDVNGFNDSNSEADIDLRDNAQRSREILEELRRRASEADRRKEEREYFDRLLKRF